MEKNVLKWLEELTGDPTFYLKPLNLIWKDDEIEVGLAVYRKIAKILEDDPSYYKEIIRVDSWRENLTAYMCLMVTKNQYYFELLKKRFIDGSFVSPQLAVALCNLHNDVCLDFFYDCLNIHFQKNIDKSKQIGAIVTLVPNLINNRGNIIELNGLIIESCDFCTGINVADIHNRFWWMCEQKKV